jgi:hypothetical protein
MIVSQLAQTEAVDRHEIADAALGASSGHDAGGLR